MRLLWGVHVLFHMFFRIGIDKANIDFEKSVSEKSSHVHEKDLNDFCKITEVLIYSNSNLVLELKDLLLKSYLINSVLIQLYFIPTKEMIRFLILPGSYHSCSNFTEAPNC